ncbi:elongation factor P [Patescibacteria group bacterium]|nr:elongation factor P [Patescibacteria group bacterium]
MSANDLKKGSAIIFKGEPHSVVEAKFVFPGKGQAFVKSKLKNLKTGNALEHVFKSNDSVEEADVTLRKTTYLYADDENFYFMDPETYDQQPIPRDIIGNRYAFMKENSEVKGVYLEGTIFDIELPPKLVFKVVEAPPGVKGDSSTNVTKKVTIETGGKVAVPLFINEGDKIRVKTDTGEYVERVK